MSSKITSQLSEKKTQEHVVIAIVIAFALLTSSILPTSDIFAAKPNDPD
ncbi:hypothetical protein [Candidatus Nitrosocosmicus franklandus]|uniref:Uncharacterized protein n=1 Tax=Candidatus Nitrosocosmicus franklandianus TaxID=1798806 RepID=A0A484I9W2_9ARCH|nr:hypothetical protein [Candidatus Nitrosocosmicus franklandus]VFJ13612.1 protein of unknown function [Candidatus Nitrosocosmicus franklandus]